MCLSLLGMMNTMSQVSTTQIPSSMTIQSSSMGSLVTAPLPVASAWGAKPHISYATATGSVEKPENHDSGVDVSDQPNSASSSTRSSPSAENKLKNEKVTIVPHPPFLYHFQFNQPKQKCSQSLHGYFFVLFSFEIHLILLNLSKICFKTSSMTHHLRTQCKVRISIFFCTYQISQEVNLIHA